MLASRGLFRRAHVFCVPRVTRRPCVILCPCVTLCPLW